MINDFTNWLFNVIFGKKNNKDVDTEIESIEKDKAERTYTKKRFMTNTEIQFYNKIKNVLGDDYLLIPQINLCTVVDLEETTRYRNELFRNIDFGIFDKNSFELLLLIEINDYYHNNSYERINRDKKVKYIINSSGYKLETFWLNKENTDEYIKYRLMYHLKPNNINNENISIKEEYL